MDVFNKEYGKRFAYVPDDKEGKTILSYPLKEENIPNDSNNFYISFPTEINVFKKDETNFINQPNNEEMIEESDKDKIISIKENNQKRIMIEPKNVYGPGQQKLVTGEIAKTTTKDESQNKKKGRRKKNCTEIGGHTKDSPDNLRCKSGTAYMDVLYTGLNKLCEKYNLKLKKPYFKNQFGWNCNHYLHFINSKIYQIFRFNNEHNQRIIRIMSEEKKDKIFIFIMSCSFKYLYKKYIDGDNIICIDEKKFPLTSFEEVVKKKRQELKDEKKSLEEDIIDIENEINAFINQSKEFINDIMGEGKLKKRQPKNLNICTYEEIDLFENVYKSQVMKSS